MVQETSRPQAGGQGFSLQAAARSLVHDAHQDVRIKTASAVFLSTMVEPPSHLVLLLHLVVLAIGAYLAQGPDHHRHLVTFESAFWEVSYNIAHLMHFIRCRSSRRRRCVHPGTARRADPRRDPSGAPICRGSATTSPRARDLRPMKAARHGLNNSHPQGSVPATDRDRRPSGSGKSTLLN